MNNQPREKLCELVRTHGRALASDAVRCEALLTAHCVGHRREVFMLVSAVQEGIAADLASRAPVANPGELIGPLARRITDNLGLAADVAHWAVESWALALGVVRRDQVDEALLCASCRAILGTAARGRGTHTRCAECGGREFVFGCPQCGARLRADAATFGTSVACPKCGAQLLLPADGGQVMQIATPMPTEGQAGDTAVADVSPDAEEMMRQRLRKVLRDGLITQDERHDLAGLRERLGVSEAAARRLHNEVMAALYPADSTPSLGRIAAVAARPLGCVLGAAGRGVGAGARGGWRLLGRRSRVGVVVLLAWLAVCVPVALGVRKVDGGFWETYASVVVGIPIFLSFLVLGALLIGVGAYILVKLVQYLAWLARDKCPQCRSTRVTVESKELLHSYWEHQPGDGAPDRRYSHNPLHHVYEITKCCAACGARWRARQQD